MLWIGNASVRSATTLPQATQTTNLEPLTVCQTQAIGWEAVQPLWWKLSDALFARDEHSPSPAQEMAPLESPTPSSANPDPDPFAWQYRERRVGVDSGHARQPLVARLRKRRLGQVRGDREVANRNARVWHGATENGP